MGARPHRGAPDCVGHECRVAAGFALPSTIYVQVLRGTPVLLQLFYLYYVLPFAGIELNAWTAGIIGMSAAYSAYLSEIYRAGHRGDRPRADRSSLSHWGCHG